MSDSTKNGFDVRDLKPGYKIIFDTPGGLVWRVKVLEVSVAPDNSVRVQVKMPWYHPDPKPWLYEDQIRGYADDFVD